MRQCFFDCVNGAAHGDDNVFRIRVTDIVHQPIFAPRQFSEQIHTFLDNGGCFRIQFVGGFAALEINVGVLCGTADGRAVRCHPAVTVGQDQIIRQHFAQHIIFDAGQTRFFVAGAEPVKEMQERHPRAQCGGMRDGGHVGCLLHVVAGQQCKSGLAHGHNVTVVAKDGQRMRRQRARGHVHHERRLFTGDFVHVRNHQQQSLGRGERRGQRPHL